MTEVQRHLFGSCLLLSLYYLPSWSHMLFSGYMQAQLHLGLKNKTWLHVRAISQAPSQLWGPQKDFSSLLAKSWGFWLTLSTISAFWHPVWFLVPSPTLPTTRDQRLDSEDQLPAGWLLEQLLAWPSMSGLYLVALGPQGWQSLVPTRNHCWQIYLSSLLVKLGYFT